MPTVSPIWNNFSSGETSPRLEARQDLAKYFASAARIENFIPIPHGGLMTRGGSRFIAESKYPERQARLISFVWGVDQAYILEFGHNYIRFYLDRTQLGSFSGDQFIPYELATSITEDMLPDLKYVQTADIMYLVHEKLPPQKLSRLGPSHTNWKIEPVSFMADLPDPEYTPPDPLPDPVPEAPAIPTDTIPESWGTDNWPRSVALYEQRSWWGGTPGKPLSVWASATGEHQNLHLGTEDDEGMMYTIASSEMNPIRWMLDHSHLVMGTTGSIWTCGVRSSLDPITPKNIRVERLSTYGSSGVQGRLINGAVVFIGRDQRKALELAYDLAQDGLGVKDLSLVAEHILKPGIKYLDWALDPDAMFWLVRNDGVLISGTYVPNEEVMAFARHITKGKFESLAVIPAQYRDEPWIIVQRQINGQIKRCLELLEAPYATADANHIADAFQVDCGLSYEGDPTSSLSGLEHLEGENVSILADGAVHPPQTVQNGRISLDWAAKKVQVGLPFQALMQTHNLEAGAQDGTAQGKKKRIVKVVLRFLHTVGGRARGGYGPLDTLTFRRIEQHMGQAIPDFSGDVEIFLGGGYDGDGRLEVVQDEPLPMTLLAIMPLADVTT